LSLGSKFGQDGNMGNAPPAPVVDRTDAAPFPAAFSDRVDTLVLVEAWVYFILSVVLLLAPLTVSVFWFLQGEVFGNWSLDVLHTAGLGGVTGGVGAVAYRMAKQARQAAIALGERSRSTRLADSVSDPESRDQLTQQLALHLIDVDKRSGKGKAVDTSTLS
jgi:hypothetical protein